MIFTGVSKTNEKKSFCLFLKEIVEQVKKSCLINMIGCNALKKLRRGRTLVHFSGSCVHAAAVIF